MQKSLGERLLSPFNLIFAGQQRHDGISYGESALMAYDEFPAASETAPLVLFWHGGSWKSGHRGMYRFVGARLQAMGAHAFVIDYPKYPEQAFPGFIDDGAAALEHIQVRFPGRRIYLMGHSAGGNTALLTGMLAKAPVDGVISIAGVCTLAERYWLEVFGDALRLKQHDPRSYVEASPQSTEYLLIHGAIDQIVVATDSITLQRKLKQAGRSSTLILVPLVEHILILPLLMFGPLLRSRRALKRFIEL